MKRLLPGLLLVLAACTPRASSPFQQVVLPASVTSQLLLSFDQKLQGRGIQVVEATGESIRPNTEGGLLYIVQQFRNRAQGFCPLAEESFTTDVSGKQFLTIFARGDQVRALIYDRTEPQEIVWATLSGKTKADLPVKNCQ